MKILAGLFTGFIAIAGVAFLGSFTIMVVGSIIASAGWIFGFLLGAIELMVWATMIYWLIKQIIDVL